MILPAASSIGSEDYAFEAHIRSRTGQSITCNVGPMSQSIESSSSGFGVAQLCQIAELEPEAMEMLREDQAPREFLAGLVEAEHFHDAVRFLAHLLPKRQGIFWAWTCARRVLNGEPPPHVTAALEATGRWVAEPTEENRRPMLEIAQQADLGTPAGCAALAVFFSGGSIAPPDAPQPVEPDFYTSAKAIAGSILLAAVSSEPDKAPEKFREFIAQGLDIGRRVGLWPAE
jgi:hypothetical protein